MPIPDTPQTRQEQYLNAIATGDASGIPDTPQCRQEQYLDAIAKNGGGGGSGGGVLVVNLDMQTLALDKTWQEIVDAGFAVLPYSEDGETTVIFYLYSYTNNGSSYGVVFKQQAIELTCAATSADGYPVVQPGG